MTVRRFTFNPRLKRNIDSVPHFRLLANCDGALVTVASLPDEHGFQRVNVGLVVHNSELEPLNRVDSGSQSVATGAVAGMQSTGGDDTLKGHADATEG